MIRSERKTFTVAGIGGSPAYIAFGRGNTTLGSGEVLGFCYILPENFDLDVYTQIFLSVEGAEEEIAFTDAYDSLVATAKEKVEELSEKRCQVRYDEVTGEAQEKIDDAKQELADGRKESDEKLADAEKTLTDGEEELEQGKKDLEDGKKQFSEARTQLDEQKAALDEQEEQLKTAEAQFGGSTPEIEAGKTKIAEAREQLSEGEKELETKESELAKAEETIKENETKLADGRKDYEEAKKEAEDKIAEGEDKIAEAEADLAALEFPTWTVSDRNDMTDYSGYADNANQMKSLGCRFPGTVFPGSGFDQPHDDDQNGRRRTDTDRYVESTGLQQELHCRKICFLCPSRYGRRQCPWCSGGRKNLPLCDHRCLPDHVSAYGRDGSGLSAGSCACCFAGSSFLYHGRNAFCLWKGTGKYTGGSYASARAQRRQKSLSGKDRFYLETLKLQLEIHGTEPFPL